MPWKPSTHGEMKNSTPSNATSPSGITAPGMASDHSATIAVTIPRTTIVVVASRVDVVQIGESKA